MSFSINISGGATEPHNDAVGKAVDAALTELEKVPGLTATGFASSGDTTGSKSFPVKLPRDQGEVDE